jgi:hypothetical protein
MLFIHKKTKKTSNGYPILISNFFGEEIIVNFTSKKDWMVVEFWSKKCHVEHWQSIMQLK